MVLLLTSVSCFHKALISNQPLSEGEGKITMDLSSLGAGGGAPSMEKIQQQQEQAQQVRFFQPLPDNLAADHNV